MSEDGMTDHDPEFNCTWYDRKPSPREVWESESGNAEQRIRIRAKSPSLAFMKFMQELGHLDGSPHWVVLHEGNVAWVAELVWTSVRAG